MPRRPITSFTATSIGSLLSQDGLYEYESSLPPPQPPPAIVARSISGFERQAAKAREAKIQDTATAVAQRYLVERAKQSTSQSPEVIWGVARTASKGITVPDLGLLAPVIPRSVRATFDAFDEDRSGYLSHRELRNALAYLGFRMSDIGTSAVLAAYDEYPDGKLDLMEFSRLISDFEKGGIRADPHAAAQAAESIVPPRVRAVFSFFDVDDSGFIDAAELRSALRHYGIDLTEGGAQEVLEAYDTHPDGKLSLPEFAEMARDASRGFVLAGESGRPFGVPAGGSSVGASASPAPAVLSGNAGRLGTLWPHHQEEAEKMANLSAELASGRGGWARDKILHKEAGRDLWSGGNGQWVRQQLLNEQHGRKAAEAEAAVAKAEAAAAIARVEALQAAATARELEIEAAAARLHRKEALEPGQAGGAVAAAMAGLGRAGKSGQGLSSRDADVLHPLVMKLEVALLDRADARAHEDSDTARLAVMRKAFRNPMVGTAPTGHLIGLQEFLNGMGILGLPQPPAVLPAKQTTTGVQPAVRSDDSLNREVLEAFFDKYKDEATGRLNFETLYAKVSREAVRKQHGQYKSQAATQKAYQDALQRPLYGTNKGAPPPQNGRPFTSGAMSHPKALMRSPVYR